MKLNRNLIGVACLGMASLLAASAQAQCQSRSRGGSAGSAAGMVASSGRMGSQMGSSGSSLLTSPGSWAYDQMLGQARAQQLAQQAYQKQMADQARRAESLARRQYWAAQRRAEKTSPGNSTGSLLAANSSGSSASMSLDILPSRR